MRPEEYDRLEAACQATAKRYPGLQRRQNESSAESAESIKEELSDFLGAVWEDRKRSRDAAEERLQPLLLLFDIALLHVCDMSVFGLKNTDHPRRVIWPDLLLPDRPSPNAVFYVLASNLAQSMQAFRLLVAHGFESQARAAFRGVVEIVDLMITVVANEATYREFIKSFEDAGDAYRHWKRHLSPAVVRASLAKLETAEPINIPVDMTPDEIRKDTYAWLSRFVHIDFAAHIVAAHPPGWDGKSQRTAMLGNVGEMSKATLAHGLMYLWISLLRLENLLLEKHGWGRFRGHRSRHWFRYRSRALDSLFRSYLPTFWEENLPADS
ncbi:hypothetical protein [Chelativorans salis]|uniref:Uncharacterized protein n=1 Tax=Chelativorans salis TaxID=2978478 RepID=A0ABT2LU73_9HYPH|nr:hypothetical protein [Chelativorans sp. EGI FJ00035]MCT7377397.1 hypothetical protein [Chelativorans sp. EGI FJ00035]